MPRENVAQIGLGVDGFGPLRQNFGFTIQDGYSVFVGANNSGKSALLQISFRTLLSEVRFGLDGTCMILADRQTLNATTQPSGVTLANYNSQLRDQIAATIMPYQALHGPNRDVLATLLLNHSDFHEQVGRLSGFLERLGLPPMRLRDNQAIHFNDIAGYLQGSGLRSVLPIICALTDDRLTAILIDEPEISLEPTLQKGLKNLLLEWVAAERGRLVMVSTHSHLFIDHQEGTEGNYRVTRRDGAVSVEGINSQQHLFDVVFRMLGNSTEDLFFPGNYLIVEGASDQVIVARALQLSGAQSGQVKVLAAGGIDGMRATVSAVLRALVPLQVNDSPYADRVVALIDAPRPTEVEKVERLRKRLEERLVVLDAASIEEEVPALLYTKAGLDREEQLARLHAAQGYEAQSVIKADISNAVASVMELDDLALLPTIAAAVGLALAPLAVDAAV